MQLSFDPAAAQRGTEGFHFHSVAGALAMASLTSDRLVEAGRRDYLAAMLLPACLTCVLLHRFWAADARGLAEELGPVPNQDPAAARSAWNCI
ncbi:hypothetical protein [Rhodopirellula sp. MGV]|uniref:hypothetical protein n=1 Tax=Rhodopirellula sp. MGV TaxID=2023130 RepID=UPI000B96AE3E|nr:hypothetical protein [Rhodopirellula sp. MGV]OYP33812.1 hypothetical protein CGZ80_17865 [Rhodopirellula sp. MGV]PNY37526.1 hypothetical protein C2E31_07280 [Rhodopirellula baltica]